MLHNSPKRTYLHGIRNSASEVMSKSKQPSPRPMQCCSCMIYIIRLKVKMLLKLPNEKCHEPRHVNDLKETRWTFNFSTEEGKLAVPIKCWHIFQVTLPCYFVSIKITLILNTLRRILQEKISCQVEFMAKVLLSSNKIWMISLLLVKILHNGI